MVYMNEWVKLLSCVQLFATPWTVAYQALPYIYTYMCMYSCVYLLESFHNVVPSDGAFWPFYIQQSINSALSIHIYLIKIYQRICQSPRRSCWTNTHLFSLGTQIYWDIDIKQILKYIYLNIKFQIL